MASASRSLKLRAFGLAALVGSAFLGLHIYRIAKDRPIPLVSPLENAAQDFLVTHLRGPLPKPSHVIIVAIDEESVEAEGLWPWSRAKMARLIERLAAARVSAVGFDMVWADSDEQGRRYADLAAAVMKV